MNFQKQMSTTFRRSLLVAIPVASVVGLTALAYAGLTMFNAGDQLSATTMNANFASLEAQIAALQAQLGDGGASSLQGQIAALQAKLGDAGASNLESQIGAIQTKLGDAGATSLESQIAAARTDVYSYTFTNPVQGNTMNVPFPYAPYSVTEVTIRATTGSYSSVWWGHIYNSPPCTAGDGACGATQSMQQFLQSSNAYYGFDGVVRVGVVPVSLPNTVVNASQLLQLTLGTYTTTGNVNVDMRVRVIGP